MKKILFILVAVLAFSFNAYADIDYAMHATDNNTILLAAAASQSDSYDEPAIIEPDEISDVITDIPLCSTINTIPTKSKTIVSSPIEFHKTLEIGYGYKCYNLVTISIDIFQILVIILLIIIATYSVKIYKKNSK